MVVGRLVYSKFDPVAPIAVLEGYKVGVHKVSYLEAQERRENPPRIII